MKIAKFSTGFLALAIIVASGSPLAQSSEVTALTTNPPAPTFETELEFGEKYQVSNTIGVAVDQNDGSYFVLNRANGNPDGIIFHLDGTTDTVLDSFGQMGDCAPGVLNYGSLGINDASDIFVLCTTSNNNTNILKYPAADRANPTTISGLITTTSLYDTNCSSSTWTNCSKSNSAEAFAVDPATGNLYLYYRWSYRQGATTYYRSVIGIFDSSGVQTGSADLGSDLSFAKLFYANNQLIVANRNNAGTFARINLIDSTGNILKSWDKNGAAPYANSANSVAVTSDGINIYLYVLSRKSTDGTYSALKYTYDFAGNLLATDDIYDLPNPISMAAAMNNTTGTFYYVPGVNELNDRAVFADFGAIRKVESGGAVTKIYYIHNDAEAMVYPVQIVARNHKVYVFDMAFFAVYTFDEDGNYLTTVPLDNQFGIERLHGFDVDAAGNFYLLPGAEEWQVFTYDPSGNLTNYTYADDGTGYYGTYGGYLSVANDVALLVGDNYNPDGDHCILQQMNLTDNNSTCLVVDGNWDWYDSTATMQNGKIYVHGIDYSTGEEGVFVYDGAGGLVWLDTSEWFDGSMDDIWTLAPTTDGKILATGNFGTLTSIDGISMLTFNPDGSLATVISDYAAGKRLLSTSIADANTIFTLNSTNNKIAKLVKPQSAVDPPETIVPGVPNTGLPEHNENAMSIWRLRFNGIRFGGATGTRTLDLFHAMEAL